jgi:hypothetical protein
MRTIKYTVSYEKMVSRLPSLFAFLKFDDQNNCEIVKATKGEQGCYGKIVANVRVPYDFEYTTTDGVELKITRGEHSYRTIIDTYYKAINDKEWEQIEFTNDDDTYFIYKDKFLAFVERGIGYRYLGLSEEDTDESTCGVKVTKKYPLAPDYIYLGEAKTLYDNMIKMQKQIKFWKEHPKSCKSDLKYYRRIEKEFNLTNGNKLIKKLGYLIDEADSIAEEYLKYTDNTNLSLNFNVNLVNTIKDLGLVTPCIKEWEAGKRYYEGDVVYYVDDYGYGMTWECNFENSDLQRGDFNIDKNGRKYTTGYYDSNSEVIYFDDGRTVDFIVSPSTEENGVEYNIKGTELGDGCWKFDGKEMNYGRWFKISNECDDNGEGRHTLPHNWYPQSLNWVKRNKRYICPKCGRVYENTKPVMCKCNFVEVEDEEFIAKTYLENDEQIGNKDGIVIVEGTCNSHLISLRRYETYTNSNEEVETPDNYKDWLWYYRVGSVMNREEKYDSNGNLGVMYDEDDLKGKGVEAITNDYDEDGNLKIGNNIVWDEKYALNLAAWGDVLTKIDAKNDEETNSGTLTFEYIIGAHLKAQKDDDNQSWYSVDSDGNYKYYFKNFEVDTESDYGKNMGVKYTETYIYYKGSIERKALEDFVNGNDRYYEGEIISENEYENLSWENKKKCKYAEESIWTLQEDGIFGDYVKGIYDKGHVPDNEDDENDSYYKLYDKMEFSTANNLGTYKIKIGNRFKKVPYLKTNFSAYVDITHVDIEERPLIRYDYYNGVSFQPTVNNGINISRGVTQAFEKHIKLGEIKTLEDFENYANGGYFTISKENIDLG